jgi:hypothetical protein
MVDFAHSPVEPGQFVLNWPLATVAAISSAWSWLDGLATLLAAGAAVTAGGLLFYVTRERPGVALGRIGWLACLCLAVSGAAHLFDLFGDWSARLLSVREMLLAATACSAVWAMGRRSSDCCRRRTLGSQLAGRHANLQDLTTRLQNEASARRRGAVAAGKRRAAADGGPAGMGTWDWDRDGATRPRSAGTRTVRPA